MSITLKTKKRTIRVPCYRSLNLLAHAQLEELEIGSRCGGHGICGGDRVRVLEGTEIARRAKLSPITEAEREHLSAEEIAQGWRLACQCFPAEDGLQFVVVALAE